MNLRNNCRVLGALTRKFHLDKNVSLPVIARRCSATFTGADLYALCADAWFQAVKRKVNTGTVVVYHATVTYSLRVQLKGRVFVCAG